jgi:hypothetical protein
MLLNGYKQDAPNGAAAVKSNASSAATRSVEGYAAARSVDDDRTARSIGGDATTGSVAGCYSCVSSDVFVATFIDADLLLAKGL